MTPLHSVPTRDDIPIFLNNLGLVNFGVEVGVLWGTYAHHMLSQWNGKRLYLVDPWHNQRDYDDPLKCDEETGEIRKQRTLELLSHFADRFEIVMDHSPDAASRFQDGSMDFVYLDGNHSYLSVKADIEAWLPKVVPGGFLMGHDYADAITRAGWDRKKDDPRELTKYGVKSAVDEFIENSGYELFLTSDDKPAQSWYFRKQ